MKIEVEFSQDGLFGSSDIDDIDVRASEAQFSIDLCGRLRQCYPDANVEVHAGNDDWQKVDGQQDSEEAIQVGEEIHGVWEDWKWVVSKPRPTPPDPLIQAKTYASRADGFTLAEDTAQLSVAYAMIALVEELRLLRKYGLDAQTFKAEL